MSIPIRKYKNHTIVSARNNRSSRESDERLFVSAIKLENLKIEQWAKFGLCYPARINGDQNELITILGTRLSSEAIDPGVRFFSRKRLWSILRTLFFVECFAIFRCGHVVLFTLSGS